MIQQFTLNEKIAIVSILSQIMYADGIIHPKEEEYMDKVYEELGLTINDIDSITNMDIIQAYNILNEMAQKKREYAHSLFVSMAESDGYVHPKEMDVIDKVFRTT